MKLNQQFRFIVAFSRVKWIFVTLCSLTVLVYMNLNEGPLHGCCKLGRFNLLLHVRPLQVNMEDSQVYFVAPRTTPSLSRSCSTLSAHVAGAAGFPLQASRPWTPASPSPLSPARGQRWRGTTTHRWIRATPPSNGTPSSSCSTTPHRQSWPTSSSWGAASRSILWSTGPKTDPLKPWRVWWMFRCWSTKVPSRSLTPFWTRWRRLEKRGFSWPNSSGQKSTGPGWRWASEPTLLNMSSHMLRPLPPLMFIWFRLSNC